MKTGRPKEDNAKRKTITIRLSEDLYKKIVEYATKHKLSKTDVALQSLEKFLSKED
jgi:predicted transcriptional regulator